MSIPTLTSTLTDMSRELAVRCRSVGLQVDVAPSGTFNATTAIVGEYPGEREKTTGMPFMGGAGAMLWNVLRNNKLTRSDFYTTNVVKAAISEEKRMSKHEIAHWEAILWWELQQLPNLRYILCLGNMALNALHKQDAAIHKQDAVTKWRGSILPVTMPRDGRIVHSLVTYNPAYTLREPKTEVVFRMDINKLNRLITKGYNPPIIHTIIDPSPAQAHMWIDKMQDEKKPVSLDIEVVANETACIGLGNDGENPMCINFREQHKNRFTVEEETKIWLRLQKFFDDPATQIIAQNGNFDSQWLWYKDRVQIKKIWFDTLLAHHTLYSTLPHNLGFLTTQYTDHPYYKDEKDAWRTVGDIKQFWEYNGKDVAITWLVAKRLLNELNNQNMLKFYFEHVMRLQPHLVRMTVGGVLVDEQLKERIAQELREQVQQLMLKFQEQARTLVGETEAYAPSPRSSKQLEDLLFQRLRLVGRGTSTDALNRKRMMDHPRTSEGARALLAALNTFKKEDKFLGTYAEMTIDPDNRVRCDWKQYGTTTSPGRLSSSSVLWGSGGNLQNQPERAKIMFVADEGYAFGYFDLSQAEARYVAWEADIAKWKEQFEYARLNPGKYDCHRALAADMWEMPYDNVPVKDQDKDGKPTLRYIAKRCRHGLNYRMDYPRLAEVTGLPLSVAENAYNIYHRKTPELRSWWERETLAATKDRMLFNAFGRRLTIMERIEGDALDSIIAFKPQSSIGDKVCQVIYKSHEDDKWPSHARIAINVHDALIVLARQDQIKSALAIMKKYAEEPIMVRGEPLIIPAETKVSVPDEHGVHRWSQLKDVTV